MHNSSWQDCTDTGRSTGSFLIFSQGSIVEFRTFVPSPVAMSSAEAECNAGELNKGSLSKEGNCISNKNTIN